MADSNGERAALGNGIDYKTLFMGACFIITVLSGAIYRFWDSRSEQVSEDSRTTNELQWKHLQQHDTALVQDRGEIERLRRDVEELKQRTRDNERAIDRRR